MAEDTFKLTPAQARFWECQARYQDFEGAVRSGKTTIALLKMKSRCEQHPGMHWLACRWSEENTKAQVKARMVELFGASLGHWNADESSFDMSNGSKIYVRGLKPAELSGPFAKFAGLTLAGILIDQPEELPPEYFPALKARLSQAGMPHEMYLLPNPPDEFHWIAKYFPETNDQPDHAYIRTTIYDNARNLPDGYIAQLERDYPPGSPLRRRFIEGRRGLSVVGEPVYGSVFSRRIHGVRDLCPNPDLPLVESWDFGHSHPAVLWSQFGLGQWLVLGECLGHNEFLEEFTPKVLQMRSNLLQGSYESHRRSGELHRDPGSEHVLCDVRICCDPAGFASSSQGHAKNAVEILQDYGVHPQPWPKGLAPNHPIQRHTAIQSLARALARVVRGAPAVQVNADQCPNFTDGLEAGYVWEDQGRYRSSAFPTLRRPKKDGLYDHLQNCAEYSWLLFGPEEITAEKIERQRSRAYYAELRREQRDFEAEDWRRERQRSRRGVGL